MSLYSGAVADLPFEPADAGSTQQLLRVVDADGKIPRALEAQGQLAGRDVVLLGESPERARWITETGARLTVVPDPASPLDWPPAASTDVVVAFWAALDGPDRAEQLSRAQRLLRPDGRLLVVLDYGRDDLDLIRGVERTASLVAWSRRDGWFLSRGFRVRVIHTFWRFDSIEEAGSLLRAAFGPAAEPAIGRLRRPRVAHNVAIYHWTRAQEEPGAGTVHAAIDRAPRAAAPRADPGPAA